MELDCLETVIGIRDKRETVVVYGTDGNLAVACPLGEWIRVRKTLEVRWVTGAVVVCCGYDCAQFIAIMLRRCVMLEVEGCRSLTKIISGFWRGG